VWILIAVICLPLLLFYSDGKIAFFVASRGHHADVGGIAPGSMPPLSKVSIR
jgi:5-oxoprolinase (ATP-hydrolysing)